MYKKFLNAILFGALILGSAGTITSCKDYDDEIDEINQKLNTMTQKDELNAQVASLTSAISAAQSGAAQAATEAANALAAAKEAAGVSDQALAAAAQAGGQSGEALTAAKNAASAAETAAANTKKAADAAAAAAADAVKAAQAGEGSAAAADKASEAAGKAQAAAAEAGKTAAAAEAAAATASEKAAAAAEKAEAAASQAGVSAKEAAEAKTAAAAAEAKAAEAAAQAAVAKQAEAAAQAAAADALKAAADAADAAKKAADAETLAKAANEASAKAGEAAEAANKLAGEANDAAAAADKLANEAMSAANKAQGAADKAQETADAAKSLAEAAKTVADAAAKQSDLAVLDETVKGINDRLQKIEDNVGELVLATIAEELKIAKDQLKALDAIASTAVTSVSLVFTHDYNNQTSYIGRDDTYGTYPELSLMNGSEKDNVFAEDVDNAITFVKGAQFQTPETILLRVSPTNAELTADMISFVNSKGVSIDEFIKVVKVAPYTELLTRAESATGLWQISVELQNYDKKAFEALTVVKGDADTQEGDELVLYAVQINNTKSDELADRAVVSTYDLTFEKADYVPADELFYLVDKKNVNNYNNRYDRNSLSFIIPTFNNYTLPTEYTWSGNPAVAPITTGEKRNVQTDRADNRSSRPMFSASEGVPFTIEIVDEDGEAPANIRAFYVTLDADRAVESNPSELNAWNNYVYENLDKVIEKENGKLSTQITVSSSATANVQGDIIGFRVYAVNYDGTLVDPDGKAFYAKIGEDKAVAKIETVITPTREEIKTTKSTVKDYASESVFNSWTWETDEVNGNKNAFTVYFVDKDNNVIFNSNQTVPSGSIFNPLVDIDFSKVVKAYTVINNANAWTDYEDDKVYTGTLTLLDDQRGLRPTMLRTVEVITITMQKVLPTKAPDGYSVKTNQLNAQGIYQSYLVPNTWTWGNATLGTMAMTNVFNMGTSASDVTSLAQFYEITFAESLNAVDEDGNPIVKDITVKGNQTLSVAKAFIDNETKHTTTVNYNFGKVSSKKNDQGGYDDYKVDVDAFETEYHDIYDSTYSWRWMSLDEYNFGKAKADQITQEQLDAMLKEVEYGAGDGQTNSAPQFTIDLKYILGESARDKVYNAPLNNTYNNSLKVDKATLTSVANGLEEYFDITVSGTTLVFSKMSGSTNPTADVPSKLTIQFIDMYNHKTHKAVLDMTVLKR